MDVNSQILYAGIKWDEMEKPDSAKNGLNNVKHEGKATLWSMVEIKIQLS